jgi:hypothetical protein
MGYKIVPCHNFDTDPAQSKRFGRVEVAISLNGATAERFLKDLTRRVEKNTGLHFLFEGEGFSDLTKRVKGGVEEESRLIGAFSRTDTYVFPEKSPHTEKYSSEYNRVEIFIEADKFQ